VVNNTGENDALNVPYRERLDKLKSDLAPGDKPKDDKPSETPAASPAQPPQPPATPPAEPTP
jgi:hypothetical protein